MRQTLFFVPHAIGGFPIFGVGILLVVWLLVAAVWLGLLVRRAGRTAAMGVVPFLVVVAIVIAFVIPLLEQKDLQGNWLGVPVRGYGTFVLAGFVLGVAWAIHRAGRRGVSPETILSLAIWMFLAGFLGARLFYVIEYWDAFRRDSWLATLMDVARITEGGLVVYGSLIAALPALAVFCWKHSLRPLVLGDIVAPALVLGLAFGRIGCLMNGCCFGGVCDTGPVGVQFPRFNSVAQGIVSPPYRHQLSIGRLHGFQVRGDPVTGVTTVAWVEPDSTASRAGLAAGMTIISINDTPVAELKKLRDRDLLAAMGGTIRVETASDSIIGWSIGSLPPRSLPVHPVQIYSAINALLICLVLVASEPYLLRAGSVVALLLTLYPPLRIVEEMIRVDEPGQFGTEFKISQYISLGVLVVAAGLWFYLFRRERDVVQGSPRQGTGLSVA